MKLFLSLRKSIAGAARLQRHRRRWPTSTPSSARRSTSSSAPCWRRSRTRASSRTSTASLWQARCAALKEALKKYEEMAGRMVEEKGELLGELDRQKDNQKEIFQYLNGELAKKTDEIVALEERLAEKTDELESLLRDHGHAIQEQKDASDHEAVRLKGEIAEYREKLEKVSRFIEIKETLEAQLTEKERLLEEEAKEHATHVSDLEQKHVQEKDRLKKEMLLKLRETKANLLKMTDNQLDTTTKRTIAENEQMSSELAWQSKETEKLIRRNEKLVSENAALKHSSPSRSRPRTRRAIARPPACRSSAPPTPPRPPHPAPSPARPRARSLRGRCTCTRRRSRRCSRSSTPATPRGAPRCSAPNTRKRRRRGLCGGSAADRVVGGGGGVAGPAARGDDGGQGARRARAAEAEAKHRAAPDRCRTTQQVHPPVPRRPAGGPRRRGGGGVGGGRRGGGRRRRRGGGGGRRGGGGGASLAGDARRDEAPRGARLPPLSTAGVPTAAPRGAAPEPLAGARGAGVSAAAVAPLAAARPAAVARVGRRVPLRPRRRQLGAPAAAARLLPPRLRRRSRVRRRLHLGGDVSSIGVQTQGCEARGLATLSQEQGRMRGGDPSARGGPPAGSIMHVDGPVRPWGKHAAKALPLAAGRTRAAGRARSVLKRTNFSHCSTVHHSTSHSISLTPSSVQKIAPLRRRLVLVTRSSTSASAAAAASGKHCGAGPTLAAVTAAAPPTMTSTVTAHAALLRTRQLRCCRRQRRARHARGAGVDGGRRLAVDGRAAGAEPRVDGAAAGELPAEKIGEVGDVDVREELAVDRRVGGGCRAP